MASYTLTIYDIPQIINKKYISISYNSNEEKSTCTIHTENRTWICTLQDLSYSKAIYKPGELIFKLQITGCSGVNAICSTFKGKKIELTAQADNKSSSIAKDYYIFGIQIEKKGNVYYATFQAYDPFKFLTLDKYCKAYTGKKFIQDIFLNEELWPNNITDKNLKGISIEDIDATQKKIEELNDQIKKETDTKKKEELEKQKNKEEKNLVEKKGQFIIIPKAKYLTYKMESETKEFIQPYLVQYNESFFDFLVRVSNRCGEFLYYEDGYFNIGLNIETDDNGKITSPPTVITEYVSVNFSDETATAWKENYIVSSHHNYSLRENKVKRFPSELQDNENIQLQDSQLASDDNLVSLPPKDEYTKWQDFALWPGYFFINAVTDIVNSADMIEAAVNLISDTGITILNCSLSAKATNDDYEDKNFKKGIYTDDRKNGDRIHPFSTSESVKNVLNSYVTFSLEFYEAVRKGIEANERSRIQIALGDHFYPLTLGCLIELDGKKYIVVQMNGCANSGAETLDIEAIPYEDKFVFPPAAPVSPIREAKAQRAFITHNADPLKMNRVRVRYPWQGKTEKDEDLEASEDSTPWIRIALPMASDGSGFNFLPKIGDEAIINYENGNIEKPYVEGMLYTRAAKEDESTVPYAHKKDKARVISSVNGHSIIFSDPSASSDALNSLSPLMSTIKSFCPTGFIRTELTLQDKDKDKKLGKLPDSFKKAMGGIEFTDEHGLYSISMSSDKRAISIDSPLGKVDINAFTGITISAPNGNVRIEGKNIDIVAGNNLSISSGNNIVSHFWPTSVQLLKESLKDTAVNALKKIQPIDMGLIRTFMETLLRPIGGTMLIKSNRYLCIEAGKGEAKIPGRNLKLQGSAILTGGVRHKETASFYGDIVSAHQFIIDLFNTCKANTIAIGTMIDQYNQWCRLYAIQQLPGGLSRNPDDSVTLLGNFVANQEYQPLKVQNRGTMDFLNLFSIAMHVNDTAKGLYKLVKKAKWENVCFSLVKSLGSTCKLALNIQGNNAIKALCANVYFLNAQNAYNSNLNANATINKEELRRVIIHFIKNLNQNNPYGITVNPPAQIPGYDDANWNTIVQNITITNSQQQVELDVPSTTGLKRSFVKAWGLNGFFDQYNWDHASGGDILFSRKEDQTLFLDNNTINEYTIVKRMEQLPIIDFLRNI